MGFLTEGVLWVCRLACVGECKTRAAAWFSAGVVWVRWLGFHVWGVDLCLFDFLARFSLCGDVDHRWPLALPDSFWHSLLDGLFDLSTVV